MVKGIWGESPADRAYFGVSGLAFGLAFSGVVFHTRRQ